jgi:catechol 2,3-dioxygenase
MRPPVLPPDTRIGTVQLRVGDLDRQVSFYQDVIGFGLLAEDGATAALGTEDGMPLLILHGAPGAPRRPPGTTGLFHVAFRLPGRMALGAMIRRVRERGRGFDGFADHNVSEAAYLTDPEGNGLELYSDRARDVWHSVEGGVFMTTEPLDVPGLLAAAPDPAPALPPGTVVGHVHLRVSSLSAAEAFYVARLGFEVTTRAYPGALFVAAGGYHHHVGLNVWGGEGAPRPPDGALGLVSFDVVVPSLDGRRLILRDADEGMLFDADANGVRITKG